MKRYSIVFDPGNGGRPKSITVHGEITATAVLTALLIKLDYFAHPHMTIREEPPAEYRTGDEVTTITVGLA